MDPFLQTDIPVMVLRYLAANKCEAAALAFINEMPILKSYVPNKPSNVSNELYLKHLSRSFNPSLKDILYDFGHSKILAEEILDSGNLDSDVSSAKTLLAKITAIQLLLKSQPLFNNGSSSVPQKDTAEASTSTETINFNSSILCSRCQSTPKNPKLRTDSSCQTDEITAVQFGLQDEIPQIFCQTLLNDDKLQTKIAQTINEHLHDPSNQQNGDVVQRISSKAESEIDKFLVDLLQDIPDDSNDGILSMPSSVTGAVYNPDLDSNLSSMFKDAESLLRTSLPPANVRKESTSNSSTSIQLGLVESLPSPQSANATTTPAPKKSTRRAPVKRITPTRLSPNTNGNPVFNASVVVHEHHFTGGSGNLSASTISVNPEIPPWRKLRRHPITPKIPGKPSISQIKEVTVINQSSQKVKVNVPITNIHNVVSEMAVQAKELKLAKNEQTTTMTFYGASPTPPVTLSPAPNAPPKIPSIIIPLKDPLPPPPPEEKPAHKRKATPVKLTPEKATNYNFMHVYHELNKSSSSSKTKKIATPKDKVIPATSAASTSTQLAQPILPPTNHFTPIQPPAVSETKQTHSDLKTISPSALQRLIVSATKVETSTSALVFHRKKSYSTPRKRRHVRNLTFTTPPSLKSLTPASADEAKGSSRKRKAPEEIGENKSKKLNWPESGKKLRRITPKKPAQKSVPNVDYTPLNTVDPDKNMSIILEESIIEPRPPPTIVVNSPNDSSPTIPSGVKPTLITTITAGGPSHSSTPSKFTVLPVQPSATTGNLPFQCFRVSDEQFVPIQTILSSSKVVATPATPILKIIPPPEISSNEHTVFNIVPAPIGFPEPTPIKFFGDTSNLNNSDVGSRSTLITPLKPYPLTPYGGTHFTLPPTPRMIEDDSNSRNSIKLMFDGSVYPAHLLGFTPNLKGGVPRTPGRGSSSSSSNSQSPLKSDDKVPPPPPVEQVEVISQPPPLPSPHEEQPKDLTMSPPVHDKSDGELTSSDESKEMESKSPRKVQKVVPYSQNRVATPQLLPASGIVETRQSKAPKPKVSKPPKKNSPIQWQCEPEKKTTPPVILLPLPSISGKAMNRRSAKTLAKVVEISQTQSLNPSTKTSPPTRALPKQPPLKPNPLVSISPISQQIQGLKFQVSGRGKKLTMSEQETLYSLIKIGAPQTSGPSIKMPEKTPVPPRLTAVNNVNEGNSSTGNNGAQTPTPNNAKNTEVSPHAILQNKNLSQLLKLVRRKSEQEPKP